MDIPVELKKRFVEDCCLPIDIFTEPIFSSRLQVLDRYYNTIEKYNAFVRMLEQNHTIYELETKATVTTYRKHNGVNIIAQSKSDPSVSQTCRVSITDSTIVTSVEEVRLDRETLYLSLGASKVLNAFVYPATATDPRILWETSDRSLAIVHSGHITAIAKSGTDGYCTITARSNQDKTKFATCRVYITDDVPLTGVDFTYHETHLEIGTSEQLSYNAVPSNATDPKLNWSSSQTDVATVSEDGVVTAKSPGTTTITVSDSDNAALRDICTVMVSNIVPIHTITLAETSKQMVVGGMSRISYTIAPVGATNKRVVWESSDTRVLTVDDSGLITAVGRGSAVVTARGYLDRNRYATCNISVSESSYVNNLEIDITEQEIEKNQTFDITATIAVGHGVDPTVTWVSSDEMYATVAGSDETTQKSATVYPEDYYNTYNTVKNKIIRHIQQTAGYQSFSSASTNSWILSGSNAINATNDAFTSARDDHTMIQISLDKYPFSSLYKYNPAIFAAAVSPRTFASMSAWENVVAQIGETDADHIIYSQKMLEDVASALGLRKLQVYTKYLLGSFYNRNVKDLVSSLGNDEYGQPYVTIVQYSHEGIILDTSKLTRVVDADPYTKDNIVMENKLIQLYDRIARAASTQSGTPTFPLRVQLFTLHKLKTQYTDDDGNQVVDGNDMEGFYKNIYYQVDQPIEFVNNDHCQLPMLIRAMAHQEPDENDRTFIHSGLIAQFTTDRKIYTPGIVSIADTSKDA